MTAWRSQLNPITVASKLEQKKPPLMEAAKLPWFSSASGRAFDGAAPASPRNVGAKQRQDNVLPLAYVKVNAGHMQTLGES
jgi:hypothetical protein